MNTRQRPLVVVVVLIIATFAGGSLGSDGYGGGVDVGALALKSGIFIR
jgi:hypothetical protein